jgi:hypothetical protein
MDMHNQCSGGQCQMGHPHEMAHGQECSGPMGQSSCACHGGHGMGSEMDHLMELKEMAKNAKHCLLKDKIKARLETKIGKKLDKMADLAVEMMMAKWKMKQEKQERKGMMMEKMKSIWMEK